MRYFFYLLAFASLPVYLGAQDEEIWYDRFLFEAAVDFGTPLGSFADRQEGTRLGFQSTAYFNLGNRPVYIGAGYRQMHYTNEREDYDELIDGELVPFNIRTGNNSQGVRLVARFQPQIDFPVQPYLEGIVEGTWWYTRTVIEDEELDEIVDRTRNANDFSPSYGAAAGLSFFFKDENAGAYLKASYLRGNTAEYYVYREAIVNPIDPIDNFEPITGPTDRWILSFGVIARVF